MSVPLNYGDNITLKSIVPFYFRRYLNSACTHYNVKIGLNSFELKLPGYFIVLLNFANVYPCLKEAPGSRPALTIWICFTVAPFSNLRPRFVKNKKKTGLPPTGWDF